MLKFAKTHEWLTVDGDIATIGISDFAVHALTDVVYCGLPAAGKDVTIGQTFGEIESVKSVSDLYAAVTGKVVEVNQKIVDCDFDLLKDSYGAGWLIKVKFTEMADNLMTAEEYDVFVKESH